MTDSNHAPNPSTNPSSPDYEGTDPDLPDRKNDSPRMGVSTVQVGASAAAAVTSALAASFFGVAGTLIGAAVGSIVSTIAGSLYSHYLARAGERLKVTTGVAIQRIPSNVIATTPLRRLTNPSDLPGRESLQPIGEERGDESVAVPIEEAGELRRNPEGMAPLDQTSVLPAYGSAAAEAAFRAAQGAGRSGAAGAASNGAGHYGPAANGGRPAGRPTRPPWKKPVLVMTGISTAGFLIALGVVLATETAIGHPISGGDSGTTISNLGNTSSETKVTPTESATPEPSAKVTDAPSEEATSVAPVPPTASADPTDGTDQGTTDQPTAESTDPAAAATEQGVQGAEATEAP